MRALFALPATGGEVNFTLKRSPSLPIIWFLEDLGRTLTLIRLCKLTLVGFGLIRCVPPKEDLDVTYEVMERRSWIWLDFYWGL